MTASVGSAASAASVALQVPPDLMELEAPGLPVRQGPLDRQVLASRVRRVLREAAQVRQGQRATMVSPDQQAQQELLDSLDRTALRVPQDLVR